ncbi:hypothetical protein EJV46_21835 [Roseococcus sp. SYP-B2431]|uniref:hypothetical protein n=1 Tax=Roseococcus sp. SYP-B2431 TaxID=2496640 RepID=UPI001038CA66|nr:hypothetical protein [Roseococcus sp. SYP-B2431]TCH96220.1 hypothetical protein EJV46_21835 [Roseococcus sp. SYP-B2431]
MIVYAFTRTTCMHDVRASPQGADLTAQLLRRHSAPIAWNTEFELPKLVCLQESLVAPPPIELRAGSVNGPSFLIDG